MEVQLSKNPMKNKSVCQSELKTPLHTLLRKIVYKFKILLSLVSLGTAEHL